jgi:hypothetical protein
MLKGLVPQMAGAMPAGALQFFAYEQTKTELNKLNKDVTLGGLRPHVTEICAAAIGAAAASIVRVPQERIKQPIQVRFRNQSSPPLGHPYQPIRSCAKYIREGPWQCEEYMALHANPRNGDALF